jgi:hypothetical protein
MLDKLTQETFLPRKGETFKLSDEAAGALELELAAVETNGLQGRAERQQFSLQFHGPREPLLPQKIYHLENAEMGALDLFLVPIHRDEEGAVYEAVFT